MFAKQLLWLAICVAIASSDVTERNWSYKTAMHRCRIHRRCRTSFFQSLVRREPLKPCNHTDVAEATVCLENELLGNKTNLKSILSDFCCNAEADYHITPEACRKACHRVLKSPSLGASATRPYVTRWNKIKAKCNKRDTPWICLAGQLILIEHRDVGK